MLRARLAPFLFLSALAAQGAPPVPAAPAGLELIDRAELLAHATALADDRLRGRLTATPGQEQAADHIAAHFESLGLEPLGDEADGKRRWRQLYPVLRTSLGEGAHLGLGDTRIDKGFALLAPRRSEGVSVSGKLALLDQKARPMPDLAGAVPLLCLKAHSGKGRDINQQFGFAFPALQRLGAVARSAEKAGAGVLLVALFDDDAALANVLAYLTVAPEKPLVRPGAELRAVAGGDQMGGLAGMLGGRLPVVFLGASATRQVLGAAGIAVDAARAWVEDEGEPPVPGEAEVKVELPLVTEETGACNVVGVLRGGDPELAGEAVVFSAHMDHVGVRLDGDAFNGADDNASGTAGLLEIAQAFARSEPRPRRSVVFLAVSGEELGLWGSAWFTEHPTWPLAQIVANVNTDMIGRGGPDAALGQVMLTPSYKHPQFSSMGRIAATAAAGVGLELVADDKFVERSDHANFMRRGIPAVFFCCAGEHEDYHQVSDHAERLDGEQMEKTARLAYWVGRAAADAAERPAVIGRHTEWLGEPRARRK